MRQGRLFRRGFSWLSIGGSSRRRHTGQVASRSNGPGLPVTGGDVLGLTAIGLGAIAAGGLVLHLRRRAT